MNGGPERGSAGGRPELDILIARMKHAWMNWMESLKCSGFARESHAFTVLIAAMLSFDPASRLRRATRAYGLGRSRFIQALGRRLVASRLAYGEPIWMDQRVGWERHVDTLADPALSRTAILKAPAANGEKGVMVLLFEYNFLRLLSGIEDFREFEKNWTIVFATSWSPTDYGLLALALSRVKGQVYVQPCNYGEVEKLRRFHPRISVLNNIGCDWLHPDYYRPKAWNERAIDILMVSNWGPFKRHWEFFRALRKMPADLRIVCVGQPQDGCTLGDIRALAERYGVPQQIEYQESISIDAVTELQCDAKLSVIFSLREGCCVAAAESLMGGAALAMRRTAHVGPKAYINERTGILLDRGKIAQQLQAALDQGGEYDSATWARETIASTLTCAKLNSQLKEDAETEELPWTVDIAEPVWRPYPIIYRDADRRALAPVYEALHGLYPEVFRRDLAVASRS